MLKHIGKWNGNGIVKPDRYTPQQVNWIIRRGKFGGHCYIMVRVENDSFIFGSWDARLIRLGMTKNQYFEKCIMHWYRKIDRVQLKEILSGEFPAA